MSAAALLERLDGLQGRGPRWRAICPAHESRHKTRSLAVFEAEDGRVLVRCHAGCSFEQIVAAAGLEIADMMPPKPAGDYVPGPKRPWSLRDVGRALEAEVAVAWVILGDMAAGRPISASDRQRAGLAADRCAHLMRELSGAS
jgi:hypothetical protein